MTRVIWSVTFYFLRKVSPIIDNCTKKEAKAENSVLTNNVNSDIIDKKIQIHRSLGSAAKNYPVKLLDSRQHAKLAEGQTITGVTFAGKGTKTEIKERYRLESDYKIPSKEWQKVSGNGIVIVKGKPVRAELHWYEALGEVFELKVKRYLDES